MLRSPEMEEGAGGREIENKNIPYGGSALLGDLEVYHSP